MTFTKIMMKEVIYPFKVNENPGINWGFSFYKRYDKDCRRYSNCSKEEPFAP